MFLNVCKQTFHISHVYISQKVKVVLIVKSSASCFHMKTKTLVDFQICISVPLSSPHKIFTSLLWNLKLYSLSYLATLVYLARLCDELGSHFRDVFTIPYQTSMTEQCTIWLYTTQKIKFSIKGFFSECDQIRKKLWIWPRLLKKSLMENFIFCAVVNTPLSFAISLILSKFQKHLINNWLNDEIELIGSKLLTSLLNSLTI